MITTRKYEDRTEYSVSVPLDHRSLRPAVITVYHASDLGPTAPYASWPSLGQPECTSPTLIFEFAAALRMAADQIDAELLLIEPAEDGDEA